MLLIFLAFILLSESNHNITTKDFNEGQNEVILDKTNKRNIISQMDINSGTIEGSVVSRQLVIKTPKKHQKERKRGRPKKKLSNNDIEFMVNVN